MTSHSDTKGNSDEKKREKKKVEEGGYGGGGGEEEEEKKKKRRKERRKWRERERERERDLICKVRYDINGILSAMQQPYNAHKCVMLLNVYVSTCTHPYTHSNALCPCFFSLSEKTYIVAVYWLGLA